jgi:hypothetical protein
MLIGTSLGKCVKSILDGDVKEEDVMFIVSNTMCPDLEKVLGVIEEYYYGRSYIPAYDMTAHSFEDAKAVAQRLYESGKLHQPRCFDSGGRGGRAHNLSDTWHEVVPTPSTHNQSVIDAYNQYQMLATLAK